MIKKELDAIFDGMSPNEIQKSRMLNGILDSQHERAKRPARPRKSHWISAAAACLALAAVLFAVFRASEDMPAAFAVYNIADDGTTYKLEDAETPYGDLGTSVSKTGRPNLEFFIEGEDIAQIEISCETEYFYILDWTETQDEKYRVSGEPVYEKSAVLTFGEGFNDYSSIWYRWSAENLIAWASEDDYSRFAGMDIEITEENAIDMAAGVGGAGHIQVDGYPEELLGDTITITVTDIHGNASTKKIYISVSNDEENLMVVQAYLAD